MNEPLGQIVVLNGAPRSGKSSIAAAIRALFEQDVGHGTGLLRGERRGVLATR